MTKIRKKGEKVRTFILEHVEDNPEEIITLTTNKFNISRQAVHTYLRQLIEQGSLIRSGKGKYQLCPQEKWESFYSSDNNLQEDVIWREDIREIIGNLPDNALDIWSYGFTEIFNNAIHHSKTDIISVQIEKNAYSIIVSILDRGVGIFNKIKTELNLLDERHAVLELTKGKLTTDPTSHTGEGIFFTSRMFDNFSILSGEVFLSHHYGEDEDWVLENKEYSHGTFVKMKLKNNTSRTTKQVFDTFSPDDEYGFTKTVVPVHLAQYGEEKMVSRSQAKRLLSRVDKFKIVIFDFNDVETIGRAFADEIFRVFANQHPDMLLIPDRANNTIEGIIESVKGNPDNGQGSLF